MLRVAREEVGDGARRGGPIGLREERLHGVGEPFVAVEQALEHARLGRRGVEPAVGFAQVAPDGFELGVEVGALALGVAERGLGGVACGLGLGAGGLGRVGPAGSGGERLLDLAKGRLDAVDLGLQKGAAVPLRVERGAGGGDGLGGAAGLGLRGARPLAGSLGLGLGAVPFGGALGLRLLGVGEGRFGVGNLRVERFGFGAEGVGASGVGVALAVDPVERGGGGGAALVGEAGLGLGGAELLGVGVERALVLGEGALAVEQGRAERFALGLAALELGRPLGYGVAKGGGLGIERPALVGEAGVVGGRRGRVRARGGARLRVWWRCALLACRERLRTFFSISSVRSARRVRSACVESRRRRAWPRRSLYFVMPAASSNRRRRSSAFSERMSSIIFSSMTEYAPAPIPVSMNRSRMSLSRQTVPLRRYSDSPER